MRDIFTLPENEQDPERDLAFWVESAAPGDPGVLMVLFDRYGSTVQYLAMWLLTHGKRTDASEVRQAVTQTFQLAFAGLADFRGQESVCAWVMGLALDAIRKVKRQRLWHRLARWIQHTRSESSIGFQSAKNLEQEVRWWKIDQLPENMRTAILLRYLCQLKLVHIAQVLNLTLQDTGELLFQARCRLVEEPASRLASLPADHYDYYTQALAELDESDALTIQTEPPETHLAICQPCKDFFTPFNRVHQLLPGDLHARWAPLEGFGFNHIPLYSLPTRTHSGLNLLSKTRVGDLLWIAGIIVVVTTLTWNMSRKDTHRGIPVFQAMSAQTSTPQTFPAGRVLFDPLARRIEPDFISNFIYTWQPQFSADGRWLAYNRFEEKLDAGVPVMEAEVMVMDVQTHQSSFIGRQGASGMGWYAFWPALSSDGNYLAFNANSVPEDLLVSLPKESLYHCSELSVSDDSLCNDIYLYDRRSGRIRLVSQALDGGKGNRHSGYAAISADGRYVAFWSAATNLIEEVSIACAEIDPADSCWDVYIRDMLTGKLFRIPVGRLDSGFQLQVLQTLSISQDGNWVALTITQTDGIGSFLGLIFSSEAYLYDLDQQVYIRLNQATTASGQVQRGNGPSRTARLTPDGRFVAFSSLADNLVTGDRNAQADVFLLDRQTDLREIVSIASDGMQGNGPSGSFIENWGSWGETISLSGDGRFVAFISSAGNLFRNFSNWCSPEGWFPCLSVLVHDRQKKETTALVPPLNAVYIFPTLSEDGRWLGLVHNDLECPRTPFCSVILSYNLETGDLTQAASGEIVSSGSGFSNWKASRLLEQSTTRVTCLAALPGENILAAGMDNGDVVLWEIESGLPYLRLQGRKPMTSALAFSPNGFLLAAGWRDGYVALYRMPGGAMLTELKTPTSSILDLAFSPDSKMLAVGGMGLGFTYEISQGTYAILDYNQYPGIDVKQVIYSPDGSLLVHGMSDGSLWVLDATDSTLIIHIQAHEDKPVTALAFSLDGALLADGGGEGRVNIWQIEDVTPFANRYFGHRSWNIHRMISIEHKIWISDLAFFPQNHGLLVSTLENGLRNWDLELGELVESPFGSRWESAFALVFSADGRYLSLASSWGGIRIWEWVMRDTR